MRLAHLHTLTALMFCFAGLMYQAQCADASEDAKELLKAYGRDGGLCIVLGCGQADTPDLPAEIAAQSEMLVHGLAIDQEALLRARKSISAKGVAGEAMVERLDLKTLPYVNDLVDLLVVADRASLTDAELLRVVAPEGLICEKKDGAWTSKRKPRPAEMDDWTHVHHGADGNMVSDDKLVRFPLGLRWIDGLPKNLNRWLHRITREDKVWL